jgi:hypothetical protein
VIQVAIHSFIDSFITYATNKRKPYLLLVAIIHACKKKKKKEEEDEKVSLAGWLAGILISYLQKCTRISTRIEHLSTMYQE